MRIGVFGGSFNPVHCQHLQIARAAYASQKLDEIWFLPVFSPVHKDSGDFLSYEARRELLSIALRQHSNFYICDAEKELGGPSYTVRTVKYLQKLYPENKFLLIIGGDSLAELAFWRCVNELVKMVEFIVAERPGFERKISVSMKEAKLHWVETGLSSVSSSQIRAELQSGRIPEKLVDPWVLYEILRKNYYGCLDKNYESLILEIDFVINSLPDGLKEHIENVARDSFLMALENGVDPISALIAGLSHDLFRIADNEEILRLASLSGYTLSSKELELPMLAHGAASAGFLKKLWPEIPVQILDAVRFHTLPENNMGDLAKILVIADALEASRKIGEREKLRQKKLDLGKKFELVVELKKNAAEQKKKVGSFVNSQHIQA
ncbi:MAG: nicotinate-nucleotide adenylyltransferase [Candidatus Rifleibacteriota bacterium]